MSRLFDSSRWIGRPDCSQRRGPRLGVADVGVADAVELEVVHAPGRELVGPRVDERLCAGRAVVDALHAAAVVVGLAGAVRDLIGRVRGALDRRVLGNGLVGDAGRDVEAELEAERVDVVGDDRDAVLAARTRREASRVRHPSAVGVDVRALAAGAVVPEVVDVDVEVAGRGQAAGDHGPGLRLDVRCCRIVSDIAPAAPAQRGRAADAVGLGGGRRGGGDGGRADPGQRGSRGGQCEEQPEAAAPGRWDGGVGVRRHCRALRGCGWGLIPVLRCSELPV